MKIKTTMYVHGCKEDSLHHFLDLCEKNDIEPTREAEDMAMYALYEVGLEVEFDTDTGESKILGLKE